MVQDNTGDSVRNRIDMIVDRQEARDQAGLVKSVNLAKPKKSRDK